MSVPRRWWTASLAVVVLTNKAAAQSAVAQVRLALPTTTHSNARVPEGGAPGASNPVTLTAAGGGDSANASIASIARNPYVGAQAGYVFGGGDFASNLVANGSVVYQVLQTAHTTSSGKTVSFLLPVRGNVSALVGAKDATDRNKKIQDLVSGAQGMRVSVEPYLALPNAGYLQTGFFGTAGWKLNAVKDAKDSTHYLALGRFSVGFEASLGPPDGSKNPIVIDLAPVYSTFASRDYLGIDGLQKSVWSGELSVIVPFGTSVGLLTEAVVAQRALPVWRTGVILTAASK